MRLFTFGDSWTEGVGGDLEEEYTTNIPEQRTTIRHKYCWPKYLSELLNFDLTNLGIGGLSNNGIFNSVSIKLKSGEITQNDFVVIMWSSSLRDDLPFFPSDNNFKFWGNRYKEKNHLYKYIVQNTDNIDYNYLMSEKNYKDFYINNLYTNNYYNIVNQNYILYLQFIFKQLGIRYLFCDGFDLMLRKQIIKEIDKTNFIDKTCYWGFSEKTFKDFLFDLKRKDIWEDNEPWTENTVGKHPNKNGYKLISEELYDFILKNKIIETIPTPNSYLI